MSVDAPSTGKQRTRLRGVQHLPQADIQNIRDLLHGYGSAGSLLKELIQNAEDADAALLDFVLFQGDPNAPHPLLRTPALCAINDGTFEPKHREAIFRLGLGTKGADPRAIGRFGKGLKSVFAVCEAFFVVARTGGRNGWDTNETICDFFNPWNGWRHEDWDDIFDSSTATVFDFVAKKVAETSGDFSRWLAFWLPLRHPFQKQDGKGQVAWIHEISTNVLPGEDERFGAALSAEFTTLAPSLVALRNMRRVRLIDARTNNCQSTQLVVSTASRRSSEPGVERKPELLTGSLLLSGSNEPELELVYTGYSGTLPESDVAKTRLRPGWPTVVDISEEGSSADQKAKGEPHYATILTAQPSERGKLEIRWLVFFPVSEQPEGALSVPLSSVKQAITLNLHGFFFLDTERRRVDGLQQHFADCNHACLEWNKIIATEGTLAHLPQALAAFAERQPLQFEQSAELARAMKGTWVWSKFAPAICRHQTWRPRWRSGKENWDLISASSPVFLVPWFSEPANILARIPQLAPLSNDVTLVASDRDGRLPGLHHDKTHKWSEELALQLLDGIQIASFGDDPTAEWINTFLSYLHDTQAMTPTILERVSSLPLLPVSVARTGAHIHISAREWSAAIEDGQLFTLGNSTTYWLPLLLGALPDWSCITAYRTPPLWFTGHHPSALDSRAAANAVLSQTQLGQFTALAELVSSFVSQPVLHESFRVAARYLMHGDAAHASDDDHFLFLPSSEPNKLIWSRLIKVLLIHEGGENSWRLLHQQWASRLSPQVQKDLGISTIDEQGAWEELMTAQMDFSTLAFPPKEWSNADVASLLHGLFQAGYTDNSGTIALLRKLRLHTLRGQADDRVSVAAPDGRLGDLFVLNTPHFEATIPKELLPLWERFLSSTKVVERVTDPLASAVQEKLFCHLTAEGEEFAATLDWNYVVRRSLESSKSYDWAELIMEALRHGDQAVRGLGTKLKQTEWLPLKFEGTLAPDSVILIEGLDDELYGLLNPVVDGMAGTRALPEWLVDHDGFPTLRKYFPNLGEALELLGLWLTDKPNWHLGLIESSLPSERARFLSCLETLPDLPGASLLAKLSRLPSQGKNSEWESMLHETVWKSLLRCFPYEKGEAERLEQILSQLADTPSRVAFDAYLQQAVTDDVVVPMLSRLSLMNQRGQWRSARQLIWPSTNLDPAAQVCHEHATILSPIRVDLHPKKSASITTEPARRPILGNQLDQEPDFGAQAAVLTEYLQPFRNGNVGDILPAALVAVLCGNPGMRALLAELLRTGLGQEPDDFIALLLGEHRQSVIQATMSERFLIEVVEGDNTKAQTLTGETITVNLTRDISSLLVGDPDALWCRYFYRYRDETACHKLRLRAIGRPDELSDPVGLFAATIETILLKVHCNGIASMCPDNLKEVLGDIADAGQSDLRRSQLYLLDMAEARLKELAVRGLPEFERVLRLFSEARQARVDAELLTNQAPARARDKLEKAANLVSEARSVLLRLLQSPEHEATRHALVEAVRRKMTDFQYNLDSFALELFQNADDAVAEWEEMKKALQASELQFEVHLDKSHQRLELLHWGRPINRHAFPGFSQGLRRGYDQDLQKMLTLNFSDKGVGEGQPTIVTGRFGLGFKTVFFIAETPEVISGRLAFEIRGGFYPVPLSLDKAKDLRVFAESRSVPGLVPTAIRLCWSEQANGEMLSKTFDEFARIAPLLAIFARRLRTLIIRIDSDSLSITCHEQALTQSGRLTQIQVGNNAYVCFRCPLRADQRPASVLLSMDAGGIAPLPEHLPRLWITTPTAEHSDFRWALNAPFKPDAGRQRLALNNLANRQIAEEIAQAWLVALNELFDETQIRWDAFAQRLGLHSTVTFDRWWQQMWNELTRTGPVLRWEQLHDGGQVLGLLAWGQPSGAMRHLVQQRATIPTKLPGAYARLVRSGDIRFAVAEMLSEQSNGCLALIADWASVQAVFPAGQTVDIEVARFLKQVGLSDKIQGQLTLRSALAAELGNEKKVNHLVAERLGQFCIECKSIFDAFSPYAAEVQPLVATLKEARLMAADGQYYPATQLLSNRLVENLIETDEVLRVAFAPLSAVLSSGYSNTALHFFVKARGQLSANAATLADWVRSSSEERLPQIFQYLLSGDLAQALADELGRPWLDSKRGSAVFQSLSERDKSELERKFLRGYTWVPSLVTAALPLDIPVVQVMPADVAFRRVSDWWARDHAKWITQYENRTYPTGFPGDLPWPGEDGWGATAAPNSQSCWLLLFIHAALVPLGFNRIGRDRSFTRFLVENRWVEVFSRMSREPGVLIGALDSYLGSFIQNTEFHFQMRQFIAFYAVSRNLDAFLYSLSAADRTDKADAFNLVFSPNANRGLSGTGIVAPPLSGMLGMGTCQLLRELYRLGRLSNPHGHRFAFTPLRKVRRLSTQLFGTSDGHGGAGASVVIFSELQRLGAGLKLDPTFKRCFDLPLQILAENKGLRTSVLEQDFEAEAMDSPELDAAPGTFSF